MDELLKMTDLHVYYGMIHAIRGISFEVKRGKIVTLIGASGAGRIATLHTIADLLPSSGDEAVYNGQNITHVPDYQLIRCNLAHVPESRRIFSQFSVLQNLELGTFTRHSKEEETESLKEIYRRFPRLAKRKNQLADTLSDGKQQMLAMRHTLVSKPEMLMLDGPSVGLSPIYVSKIFGIIKSIHESDTTVLPVGQNTRETLSITSRAYVLETGTIRFSGTAEELLHNTEVEGAYLNE